nr:Glycosyltransferase, DXD sugar-binding motif protein [Ipomoea batatas]
MFRNLRSRRRPRYGAQLCAVAAAILLLLSVSLLYTRLNFFHSHQPHSYTSHYDAVSLNNPLVDDLADPDFRSSSSDDRIDEFDDAIQLNSNDEENSEPEEEDGEENSQNSRASSKTYFYDHQIGVVRRAFNKRSIEEWEDYVNFESSLKLGFGYGTDESKEAIGSDDLPVDEKMRKKLSEVRSIEDALLLKGSPLREVWGDWFDKKSEFLRKDRMFRSNLESLNPNNNPMLQDPDGVGLTGLSRGDRVVLKGLMNEFKKVPFLVKKPLSITDSEKSRSAENNVLGTHNMDTIEKNDVRMKTLQSDSESVKRKGDVAIKGRDIEVNQGRSEIIRAERRSLKDNANNQLHIERVGGENVGGLANKNTEETEVNGGSDVKIMEKNSVLRREVNKPVYADGKRWGYFPGLQPRLSFMNFMDLFFRKGKCNMRVFMVWNSPPWMFSVRHQRGLESLLYHHPEACVVVFSETIELNFFSGFVKEGFKVAVAMPNLDELLKDTPTHIFASVWHEWKKTKYYPTHYSELIRLAALYKYGGVYLDSDIIVLNQLSSLNNTVGMDEGMDGNTLSGAVMAFRKHSPFIMECLNEFYSSYDDSQLRWNGAELLTRVAGNFSSNDNVSNKNMELRLQPSFLFFPISHGNILRYLTAPVTDSERSEQDALFKKILHQSLTFHLWNSITSATVPEPNSLVARILNHRCLHCSEEL